MLAELKHTLRRQRGAMIGWGIGLALYGLLMVYIYDTLVAIPEFAEMMAVYPVEFLAFFGDFAAIATPRGYLDVYYFTYMPFVIGVFVAVAGAGLLVSDEEKGILDLVLAQPVSRTGLFWGRVAGFVIATVVILLISWLSWVLPSGSTGMDLTWLEFLRPFVPLFAVLMLFGMLALLLSLVLPAARLAAAISGGLIFANWLLLGLANLNEELQTAVKFTPLYYLQGGEAVDGLNWTWLAGLLGAAVILALLSWWLFQRRDIRVGGEGGWRLPSLRNLNRTGSPRPSQIPASE